MLGSTYGTIRSRHESPRQSCILMLKAKIRLVSHPVCKLSLATWNSINDKNKIRFGTDEHNLPIYSLPFWPSNCATAPIIYVAPNYLVQTFDRPPPVRPASTTTDQSDHRRNLRGFEGCPDPTFRPEGTPTFDTNCVCPILFVRPPPYPPR